MSPRGMASEGPPVKEIILGIIVAIEAACAMLVALVIPLRKIIDMFEAAEKRQLREVSRRR